VSTIELHVAEVYLEGLIERVEAGEIITITRRNVPVATIVPVSSAQGLWDPAHAKPAGGDPKRAAKGNRLARLSLRQPPDIGKP
jgi:prevent-host-death family protein